MSEGSGRAARRGCPSHVRRPQRWTELCFLSGRRVGRVTTSVRSCNTGLDDVDGQTVTQARVLTDEERRQLLREAKVIAIVGLSDSPWKPSQGVAAYLQRKDYRIIPVNPNRVGKAILGEPVVATLADIAEPVDIVDVFRPAQVTPKIAREAVAIGAKALWLQLGIANDEAAAIATAGGLPVVMDRCIATEVARLRR